MNKRSLIRSNYMEKSKAVFSIIVSFAMLAFLIGCGGENQETVSDNQASQPQTTQEQESTQPVINYNSLEKDDNLNKMMEERKAKLGVKEGVDLIVKSDESLQVGSTTVSMKKIIDKINLQSGDLIESDIRDQQGSGQAGVYGVYVVQPNDNIWNIHFKFLRDYFDSKNIPLSDRADEPDQNGYSSGVGKLLKFSEKLAYIYNLNEAKLDISVDSITPMSKVVVYNMKNVFDLLDQIDYDDINSIKFDGETLWLGAQE